MGSDHDSASVNEEDFVYLNEEQMAAFEQMQMEEELMEGHDFIIENGQDEGENINDFETF